MALLILLAFASLPIIEIAIFIEIGEEIGLVSTLAATVLTALVGTFLVRAQGLATLRKLQESLNQGEMPLRPAFDGACQLFAGALLLTPGFLTDGVGLLLFVPLVRTLLMAWVISRGGDRIVVNHTQNTSHGFDTSRRSYDVEGDYMDITPSDAPSLPPLDKNKDH